ncbi:IS256 family transposase, partial [Escherichia albertii]|nr:IS256 family transposase [Escherichia albertii]
MTDECVDRPGGADVVSQLKASGALDELFARIDAGEIELTGDGGMIPALIKETLERGLQAEMTSHLGYGPGDRAAKAVTDRPVNARNGSYSKTVASEVGEIELTVPRDRDGSFTPRLVPKGSRRLGGLDEMIISLYAGGMTIRDIQHHLADTIGTELSHETIANITDAVLDAVVEWQNRPLDEFYPVIYLDAIRVKVRDNGHVRSKAAHIAVGVDMDGIKHVLGIWVQNSEGAAFWAHVCAELANRGIRDVLIVCCDGLTGLPEAIEATWPDSLVQTCVVHLIRAANRFVAYGDRKAVSQALKAIYTAANEATAQAALDDFAASELGQKYPSAVATWKNAWARFVPFLAFPPALRRVIYTTNAIESLNYQLRKVTKNRSQFPTDEAVVKLLWLAICTIEDKRARQRAKERSKPASQRKAAGRLVEGQTTMNWKQALAQLAAA